MRRELCLFWAVLSAYGQGMDHSKMPGMAHMGGMNAAGMFLMDQASGTSMNPRSWPMPMMMAKFGSWQGMFMGSAFLVDTGQFGP